MILSLLSPATFAPACAEETVPVKDGYALMDALQDRNFKGGTLLLEKDIFLPENELWVDKPSLTIEGQEHALKLMPGTQIQPKQNGYLKLQNISDLGSFDLYGLSSRVSLESVVLTGNSYAFDGVRTTLSAVRTDWKNEKANLQLSGVGEVRFVFWLLDEKTEEPAGEEKEKLCSRIRKSVAGISLKKVTDADGNPVKDVTFEIRGRGEEKSWTLNWTETWNGK